MVYSTIREILADAERRFGKEDAVRYKVKKDTVESNTAS